MLLFLSIVIVYNDSIIRFTVLSYKVYIRTMKTKERIIKGTVLSVIMIMITGILITLTGVLFHQSVQRMIPLYVSLVVGMLQSRANRYANLIGGINALLYAVVYFYFGLYASAANALLVSFPIQIATFIRWSNRSYKHSTKFRRLSAKSRIILSVIFAVSFSTIYIILSALNSEYRLLDLSVSLISVVTSVLALLSFMEYSWTMLGTGVFSIVLDISMMRDHPGQITYFVFSIYSMICIILQIISVHKLYKEQMKG